MSIASGPLTFKAELTMMDIFIRPQCRPVGARKIVSTALVALALAGLSSGTACAAEGAPMPGEPAAATSPSAPKLSVDEILRRNATARGGIEQWNKLKTMVQIGRIERAGEVPGMATHATRAGHLAPDANQIVGFRLELARPNKMRYELTYQGATAIQAFDGKEGFTVQPGPSGAVARPFSESQTRAAAEQLDLEGPLLGAATKGTVVRLEGTDTVHDRPAYKLSLKMKSGVTRHVWVDTETFLDVKIDGTRQIGDRAWPVETLFQDFRKVGSVQVPYQIETTVGGVHTMESVKLIKVVLNAPLEDTLFTLPRSPAPAASTTPAKASVDPQ
jgi:hypothetical protein